MKRGISPSAARASAGTAILTRLFYGLMVESPEAMNGAWLSAAAGLLLALPALWTLRRRWQNPGPLMPALAFFLLLDAAATASCAAFSEGYLAFSHAATPVLMLPLALAALRCAFLGGDAIGASARVWLWALSALTIVVVLCQFPYYRSAWIFPLLGHGARDVLRAAVRSAGWIVTLVGAAMLLCDEAPRLSRVWITTAVATAAAMALMLLRLMMVPSAGLSGAGPLARTLRIDSLLTNGRAPLDLQLPMIVIWFIAMLHLLCFQTFACAALLKKLLPALPYCGCAAVAAAAVFGLAISGIQESASIRLLSYLQFPALALIAALWKGGAAPCAESSHC